jgi:hypothetical protein
MKNHSIYHVKLRPVDTLYTKYIRLLYNYTCQKCGRYYPSDGNLRNLGVSHFFGRAKESTRFDDDNVTLLCNMPCHQEWEHQKKEGEYKDYMLKRLGQQGFDLLELKSNQTGGKDDAMNKIIINQKIKELENGGMPCLSL